MSAIEFDARITNGTIEVPSIHRGKIDEDVHVIIYPRRNGTTASKIDELIREPLSIADFRPLAREEAHERR